MKPRCNSPLACIISLLASVTSGCSVTSSHGRNPHSAAAADNGGIIVTWQQRPSVIGDRTAFTVSAVNASGPINLPTNIPPAWQVEAKADGSAVALVGTAPIGASVYGLSLQFSAEFPDGRQTNNVLVHPRAFYSEDKNPSFRPCDTSALVLCYLVSLGQPFESDTDKNYVTISIDSTGSALSASNRVYFEVGQRTKAESLESGNVPGRYDVVETHAGQPNWIATSGKYRVVLMGGTNLAKVKVHGIQTKIE